MARCPKHCYARHYGTPHVQCSVPTKKGTPCPHHGATSLPDGERVCALHDPDGTAQANLRQQKLEAERRGRAAGAS